MFRRWTLVLLVHLTIWPTLAAFIRPPMTAPEKQPKPLHLKEDPEEELKTADMIRFWGYPAEVYNATTDDGYILEMQRIPYGIRGPSNCGNRPVILMVHGLESSSADWVMNLPNESPGFLYADAGFDVFLGNVRGNTYGKNHRTLTTNDEKFWEFSWDEIALQDLPALINKALEISGQPTLYYMGHSQGTLTMFTLLSINEEIAEKVTAFYALAPVGTVSHIQGLIKFTADYFLPEFTLWYDIFGSGEFLPNNWATHLISEFVCGLFVLDKICDNILFLIGGPEQTENFNATRTAVYTDHSPAGTSTQNIMHWSQLVKRGAVARYDYNDKNKNKQHYGQETPPTYDFSAITRPVHLYWSDADWLATPQDISEFLLKTIKPEYIVESVNVHTYNHLDFVWGINVKRDIHDGILAALRDDGVICQA